MRCTHGDVVVETKAHGSMALRMMARRPHATKGGLHLTTDNKVDAFNNSTRGPPGCSETVLADDGIRIESSIAGRWRHRLDSIEVTTGMHAEQLSVARLWRIELPQHVEQAAGDEPIFDRRDSSGVFWVTLAGIMAQTISVANVRGSQGGFPLLFARHYPL